jgi:hypothetical protein
MVNSLTLKMRICSSNHRALSELHCITTQKTVLFKKYLREITFLSVQSNHCDAVWNYGNAVCQQCTACVSCKSLILSVGGSANISLSAISCYHNGEQFLIKIALWNLYFFNIGWCDLAVRTWSRAHITAHVPSSVLFQLQIMYHARSVSFHVSRVHVNM